MELIVPIGIGVALGVNKIKQYTEEANRIKKVQEEYKENLKQVKVKLEKVNTKLELHEEYRALTFRQDNLRKVKMELYRKDMELYKTYLEQQCKSYKPYKERGCKLDDERWHIDRERSRIDGKLDEVTMELDEVKEGLKACNY